MRVAENVVFRDLGGEGVLLDLATGTYFGLNGTGTMVWQMLCAGRSTHEIAAALARDLDVSEETALADVAVLVAALTQKGLVGAE